MKSKLLFLNEKHIKIHFFGRNETAGRTDARTDGRTHGRTRETENRSDPRPFSTGLKMELTVLLTDFL